MSLTNIKTVLATCEIIKVIEKATARCLQQTYYCTNYGTNKKSELIRPMLVNGGLLTRSSYLVDL